ncbi:Scr1 family TA system antitoxin-like transcriptional regulator [Nocardia nova]|uniref:Scr1 family TA system antitoxin-like transcriptional regulator n=1 Tax=Nocardia nova TaxID=37330 RepID=UPI0004B87ED4|nr:Scr1 family TA system antitoxin-like transcriptional regulator [Nocardia nova]
MARLLDFGSPRLPTLGWSETVTQSAIVEDETEVSSMAYAFAQALTQALSVADSVALIKDSLRE